MSNTKIKDIYPGLFIKDIINKRGWSVSHFALRMDITEGLAKSFIDGTEHINDTDALKLEYVLGYPQSFWITLERAYIEHKNESISNNLPKTLTEKENMFILEHMNAIIYSIMSEADKLSDKNIYDECNELFKLFSSYILYIQYGEVEKDSPLSKLLNYIKESE